MLLLSKILPALLFPAGLTIVLCLLAALLAFRKGARAAGFVTLGAALLLYAAANPQISNFLLRSLEARHPPAATYPPATAIVLLGGGMVPLIPPRTHPETNWAGDRLLHAARLYKDGAAPVIVATGGYIDFMNGAPGTEADVYKRALMELFAVPDSAILVAGGSRTTAEDAEQAALALAARGLGKNILLVTSASHMSRAVAVFTRAGFDVTPAPTDFVSEDAFAFLPFHLLPNARALAETTIALHEYLGLLAYKLAGKT